MPGILLTHGYFLIEDAKEQAIMKPYPPLGLLYISAFLEEHGFENSIFDSTFSSLPELKELLLQSKPEILGIYTNLMTKLNVLKIIRFVKENDQFKKTKIILGGPEVRNHAVEFLTYGADLLVLGEGEESMLEVVQFYLAPGQQHLSDKLFPESIPGVAYVSTSGDLVVTPRRALLRNMDDLPEPNRKKINLQNYLTAWKNKHGENSISVSTMRGCPYTCKWCSRAVYGQTYRRRSPTKVVDELQKLQSDYSFDNIWFVDDVFTISHKWLGEFCNEIEKRKLSIRYECITRADRLNESVIQQLAASGCFRVWIGAESGSQAVIDAMDRRVDVNQVRSMIQCAKKYQVQAGTFIMLGYPGETEADIEETIRHLKISDPDFYTVTIAYPIKGTPLYEEMESAFIKPPVWEESTDRDIDFKRTYSRRYYDFAIRRLYNEVSFHKASRHHPNNKYQLMQYKLKSILAKTGMMLERHLR